jgi:hypothetical protein
MHVLHGRSNLVKMLEFGAVFLKMNVVRSSAVLHVIVRVLQNRINF